jgi:hypothetical protein
MTAVIKLPFAFTDPDPDLRIIADHQEAISSIPSLVAWHSVRTTYATIDGSTNMQTLTARAGTGSITSSNSDLRPAFHTGSGPNGHDRANFAGDGLLWGGTQPTTSYTFVVVFRVDSDTAVNIQTLIGNNGDTGAKYRIYIEATNATPTVRHQSENYALLDDSVGFNILTTGYGLGEWHVAFASFAGGTGMARVSLDDQSPVETDNEDFTSAYEAQCYIGCGRINTGVANTPFDGDIADVMVFSADLFTAARAADMAKVRAYLREALGLTA